MQINTDQYQYFVLFIDTILFIYNNKNKQLFDVFCEWTDFFCVFQLALVQYL